MTTQFYFFSGKGGVGKTSMACATAVRMADEGKKTLIVTTDPASNLADVFEQSIGHAITAIKKATNLWAMEIDSDRATAEYKDRALSPLRDLFPAAVVQVMEEQMNSPCTAEVAAFDRFTDFLDVRDFDAVIFDTAPTGHTLRLLELPAEWAHTIEQAAATNGQTCIGPAVAIRDAKEKYERALAVMRDSSKTTFTFVLMPEATPLKETLRATNELMKLDISTNQLIINGIIPAEEASNSFFKQRVAMQKHYLELIERALPQPKRYMPLLDGEIKGIEGLRDVASVLFDGRKPQIHLSMPSPSVSRRETPSAEVLARLEPNGHRRVIFFAGKGGVGKTSASCMTAVWLARRGFKTLLLTTDPAAHIGDVLGVAVTAQTRQIPAVENLWAAKIDAKAAAETYKQRILDDAKARGRPGEAIAAMSEELDSPCTEEMAAFDSFIDFASQDQWDSIVFDTAPTGHTLRLLELPIDWSRQLDIKVFASVDATAADDVAKKRFADVIDMMRDPERSTFAFVMYPESTPIAEAGRAIQELDTVGIRTGLVVANLILPEQECTTPFARARRAMQERYLNEIARRFSVPILRIPLLPHEVRGIEVLDNLGAQVLGQHQRSAVRSL